MDPGQRRGVVNEASAFEAYYRWKLVVSRNKSELRKVWCTAGMTLAYLVDIEAHVLNNGRHVWQRRLLPPYGIIDKTKYFSDQEGLLPRVR